MSADFVNKVWLVLCKEVVDALRDRRTLSRLLAPAILMGPLLLLAVSAMISSIEEKAEKREIMAVGIEHAPTLRNYLERQTFSVVTAPQDYESRLRAGTLLEPVLVIQPDFELALARGERPIVELVSDSANQRASTGLAGLQRQMTGFNRERAAITMALRGVSTDLLQAVAFEDRDLASTQASATRFTSMIPMFIIMAVLYGALTSALDSTAGERERGSLEPLLMNPVQHMALVLGKWVAVVLLGMVVALMASLSFIPAQWLIKSDSLQAMFQFGASEMLAFLLLQVPLACGLGAVLMALAIQSKTFKEAQAGCSLVIAMVAMAPMIGLFNPGGDAVWYLWVPGLGQNTLMVLVLKGESMTLAKVLPGVLVALVLTLGSLTYVARTMRRAVAR